DEFGHASQGSRAPARPTNPAGRPPGSAGPPDPAVHTPTTGDPRRPPSARRAGPTGSGLSRVGVIARHRRAGTRRGKMLRDTQVTVVGNVTRSPEVKHRKVDGRPFTVVPIAVNNRRFDAESRQWVD